MSTHKYMDKICCLALLLALVVTGVFLNAPSLGIQAASTAQGYTGSMIHNYYLYEEDGQLSMIPWDYNLAFGGFAGGSAASAVNDPIDTPSSSERPLVTALLSDEDCLERYHSALYDLATFLTDGSMDDLITELAGMIDESVQNDPTKECTYEDYLTAIETLRSFCALRG